MDCSDTTLPLGGARIAIIGAGVIGLSCAWQLGRRGANVTLFDAGIAGRGASWAAAGMLAPAFEAGGEEDAHPRLLELCLQSAELWPGFCAALEKDAAGGIGYVPGPSIAIARTAADEALLSRIETSLSRRKIDYEPLSPDQARAVEPSLGGTFRKALALPTDGQVDNRLVVKALVGACIAAPNIRLRENALQGPASGISPDFDQVIITAGWQSGRLFDGDVPLQPVGGQLLSVARITDMPTTTLRSGALYIAPKQDRVVIGATVEPGIAGTKIDAGAIAALQAEASELCPSLRGAEPLEAWRGVRPGTPDGAPIIQRLDERTILAAGHYRNGILLAPVTAQRVVELVGGDSRSDLLAAFGVDRFAPVV